MNRMFTCIAITAVCSSFLHCASKKQVVVETPPATTTTAPANIFPLKATLSGIVKNEQGEVLPHAAVQLNNGQVMYTDASGRFSIETEIASDNTTANLYLNYEGMVPAVRSYHAAMQHSFYEVTMHPPYVCCVRADCFNLPFNTLMYNRTGTTLEEDMANQLGMLADSLKAYPNCLLQFTAYGKGNKPGSRADERLRQIQLFFTGKGITENRIVPVKIETMVSDIIELGVRKY